MRRHAAEMFPPGDFIREEMEERGLAVAHLAAALKTTEEDATALLDAERPLTAFDAFRLHRLFGTGPELWMNLQASWDEWREWKEPPEPEPFTPIETKEWSPRTYNTLRRHGITSVEQVDRMSDDELLGFNNLGKISLHEIRGRSDAVRPTTRVERPLWEDVPGDKRIPAEYTGRWVHSGDPMKHRCKAAIPQTGYRGRREGMGWQYMRTDGYFDQCRQVAGLNGFCYIHAAPSPPPFDGDVLPDEIVAPARALSDALG